MTAREDLYGALMDWHMIHLAWSIANDATNEMLDAYAHELAEQIREARYDEDFEERFYTGVNCAADLIDPEVEN